MLYDINSLKKIYEKYSNINQKIGLETRSGGLTRIKRGLYSNDVLIDAPIIANMCCSPSYISFEYALSYYGLIPEYISMFTSAVFNKKNYKIYRTASASFEYRSIPNAVFKYGITFMKNEKDIRYKIATKEKALCDTLYSKYPVRSIGDLKVLLFDDLRIDEDLFLELDFNFILDIAPLYHSNTLLTLQRYIRRLEKCRQSKK